MSSLHFFLKIIVLFLFSLWAPLAICQNQQIKYLGTDEGLSNNSVYAVLQDHNGFMWFATYDGLNRYNGYEFTVFRNIIGDSTSIHSNQVNSMAEDTANNIWIGGQREVSVYNMITGRFSIPTYRFSDGSLRTGLNNNVLAIARAGRNTMLAGTQNNGLFYFDNTTRQGIQVPVAEGNNHIVDYYVSAIRYDADRDIAYVLVQGRGLYKLDAAKHILTKISSLSFWSGSMAVSQNGSLWIANNTGVYKLNPATNEVSKSVVPAPLSVADLYEDKSGTLWIATDGSGVWTLPAGQTMAKPLSATTAPNGASLNSNSIYAIYEDRQQRKWLGTLRGGVNIVEPQSEQFRKVVYRGGITKSNEENFIFCFAEAPDNNIWIGTDGAGLRLWNRTDNSFINYRREENKPNSISSNFVTSIVNDNDGRGLWVATWFAGVNYYDPQSHSFTRFPCVNPYTSNVDNNVWTLLKDSHERLWAAAVRNAGLYLFNRKAKKFELFENRFPDLQTLVEDSKGDLWGGDYANLINIDTLHKHHRVFPIGFTVRSIYEDSRHRFWIGTQGGGLLLFSRQTGTYKQFTTNDGLPHNTVLRILEDSTGNLWLSTYNGLSRFNPLTATFKNFSKADGLLSNQFNFKAALKLSNGEMLFGGINGFNIFDPQHISIKKITPPLFLSDLTVNNAPVQQHPAYIAERNDDIIKRIVVPFNEADFSLQFLGLDYSNAANINYAYLLQGWDKNWNTVKTVRTANYSRLHEGNYIFKVRVSLSGEEWSEAKDLLYITVLPPWYRTWWAYVLYVMLGAAAIYLYSLYKSRQAKLQYEVQLAHLQVQKEKELNEKKIAFFTNVSHEFRAPLSLIINPLKDMLRKADSHSEHSELKVVYRNAKRLLRLVDHLLLFKKAESEDRLTLVRLNFVSLCKDVFACFTEQARSQHICYRFECEQTNISFSFDREKMEIALFNILSNAFKYTPDGGAITFALAEEEKDKVRITVSDTGIGIPPEVGKKLFNRFYQVNELGAKSGFGIGLYITRAFVEAHNGCINYDSTPGKGTTFTIELHKTKIAKPPAENFALPTSAIEAISPQLPARAYATHSEETENTACAGSDALPQGASTILSELQEEVAEEDKQPVTLNNGLTEEVISDKPTLLIIDDDSEILQYLVGMFSDEYRIYKADCAEDGIRIAHEQLPDLIISDIVMKGLNGLDLCRTLKEDETVCHIPIILLTGTSSDDMQLKSMETGADDFIKKPFDREILAARVKSLLNRRNILQNYFYNEVTLGSTKYKISPEYKEFLQRCMKIIEAHLDDDQFSIKVLASEMGMSHSNLYKKVKSVSGQTINGFIKFIRLRKAAEILITTDNNINETAFLVGFNDVKYFRGQFQKQFGVNPSEYMKKYRKQFQGVQNLEAKAKK